jgi:hypothetical protein
MSSSVDRRARRFAKKNLGHIPSNPIAQIQKVLGDLTQVGQATQQVQELGGHLMAAKEALAELVTVRDDLLAAVGELEAQRMENAKQRAVFLRFFMSRSDLLLGGGDDFEKFVKTEERYRREYDGMLLLVALATWAKEAP